MADISITKYKTKVTKPTASPSNPGYPTSDPIDPVNPPASGAGGGGINTFLQLTDTPASYMGQAGLFPRVNSGETGLEFFNPLLLPLTGYTVGSNTELASTDTILGAFGKVQGQINAKIGGTIASGQVAFGTGVNTVGGDSGLVWDNVNKKLSISSTSISEGFLLRNTTPTDIYLRLDRNSSERARIIGVFDGLSLRGAQVIRFETGTTEYARITSTGLLGISTTSPTNTLDVNGTARIRTLSNATGDFVTASATGVLQKRTAAEVVSDLGIGNVSPQIITSTGTLNDVALTSTFVVFTGSSVTITGFDSGVDGKELTIIYTGTGTLTISPVTGSSANNQIRGGNVLSTGNIQKFRYYNNKWYLNGSTFNQIQDSNDIFRLLPTVFGSSSYTGFVGSTVGIRSISGTPSSTKFFRVHNSSNTECISVDETGYFYINDRFTVNNPSSMVNTYNAIKAKAGTNSSTLIAFRVDNSLNSQLLQVWCNGDIGLFDSGNIRLGATTGTKIGTATSQKLAFWNATPIVQPSGDILVALANLGLVASPTIDASSIVQYKLLDEDITPTAFTSGTYATLLTGGILGTNSFDGATDASYEGTIFIRSTSSGSYNFDLRLSIWSQNIDTAITIGAITGDIIHKVTFKLIIQSGNFLITGLTQFTDSAFTYGYEINPSMTTYTASSTSSLDIQAQVSGSGSPTLYMTSFVLKQIA